MISNIVSRPTVAALLNSLCQFSSEGIVVTDTQHRIQYANTAFKKLTGYSSDELIGSSIQLFRHDRQDTGFFRDVNEHVRSKGIWNGQMHGRRQSGDPFSSSLTVLPVPSPEGVEHLCYLFRDISQIREYEARLQYTAQHDPLTDLPNRMLLLERTDVAISQAARKNRAIGIIMVDLDDFKKINDGLGHSVGDEVLKITAERLDSVIRSGDSVARSGGDDFTVLLPDIRSPEDAGEIAERILHVLAQPFVLQGSSIYLGATLGVSIFPDDGTSAQSLMRNADLALMRSKERYKGSYQFFTPDLNERAQERIYLEETVRSALDHELIQVYFQPVIDMETGKLSSSEALARLFHPERGEIPPGQFIPLAEESGLIYRLGEYVFRKACTQYAHWLDLGAVNAAVGINLSARQFMQPNLVESMLAIVEESRLPPDRVIIEITENSLMFDVEKSIRILRSFKDAGMRISIDDFGTGYSSLSYLKTLPVDQLKIDRSFINDLTVRDNQAAIVTAIISMAHSMRMRVVAEGVETKQQFDFLKQSNCDFVQGYYFSRPLSVIHAQPHFEKETVYFYGV